MKFIKYFVFPILCYISKQLFKSSFCHFLDFTNTLIPLLRHKHWHNKQSNISQTVVYVIDDCITD